MIDQSEMTELENQPPQASDKGRLTAYVQAAAAIGAALVGLTAYVYVLGGVVMWFRLTAARLPQDEVTAAFQDRQLLAAGMKTLMFEALLLVALSFVVWIVWRAARCVNAYLEKRENERRGQQQGKIGEGSSWNPDRGRGNSLEEDVFVVVLRSLATAVVALIWLSEGLGASGGAQAFLFAVVLGLGVTVGAVTLFRTSPGWLSRLKQRNLVRRTLQALRWIVIVGLCIFAIFVTAAPLGLTLLVLLVLLQFSAYVVRLGSVKQVKELIVPILILTVALNVVIIPYLATPPVTFDRAEILTTQDGSQVGAFIGRSSDGVYLATCLPEDETTSKEARIRVIPSDKIEQVVLGGRPYSFDYGKRPSLFGLAEHIVNQEPIGGGDALELDLRDGRLVCGATKIATVSHRRRGQPTP